MKNFTLQFVFVAATLLTTCGCSKQQFASPEKKLTGKWKFEKVTFQKQFSLCNKDVSDDFKGVSVEFKNDKTVFYTDTNSGLVYAGNYDLRPLSNGIYNYAGEYTNTQIGYELDINLASGSDLKNYSGENVSVTLKKIFFTETKNDGFYSYHLMKQ